MKRLAMAGCVAFVVAGGLVGCQKQQKGQVQAPPPPEPQPMASFQPFEPVPVQPGGPQPMMNDPYAPAYGGAPAAQGGNTYTVQKGDTIFAISRKVYGSNARARDIINANPGINPDRITVGQVLNLPD